jgi:hypothetical protein
VQPQDLLALVELLFHNFVDRFPQALELHVLLRLRPPIRLCKLAELPVPPGQPTLQVQDRRIKPDDFDVRVLRKEFPNQSTELDELEFAAQRLEINTVFHRDFRRRPSIATRNSRKCASEARERTS